MAFLLSDGRPVFRLGTTLVGLASDGEVIFGLPGYDNSASVTGVNAIGNLGTLIWDCTVTPAGVAAVGALGTLTVNIPGGTAGLVYYDGRPIFRIGSTTVGLASDGEVIFGLAAATEDATVNVDGVNATGNLGTLIVNSDGNQTVALTGVFATGNLGSVTVNLTGSVTIDAVGLAATGYVGNVFVLVIDANSAVPPVSKILRPATERLGQGYYNPNTAP